MKTRYFLRIGNDYLEQAQPYRTLAEAKAAYKEVAAELARYGQAIEATIHMADNAEDTVEYPDFLLTLNEHGRVVVENT